MRMRKMICWFIWLVVLMEANSLVAQPAGFNPIENMGEFKKKFSEEGKKLLSIRSNFIQEKTISVMDEKIISEGVFFYKQERKVRIEYQKPFRYLMIMNGDQIFIRDEKKESHVSTHSSKLFQKLNQIIVDCINGSILENKDFTSRVFQNDNMYWLEMVPVSKAFKNFFQSVQVLVDKKDWSAVSISLEEPGGDNTVLRFSDKVLNEKVDDAKFVR
jgi:outer membrane lipoprotein-sorting protein